MALDFPSEGLYDGYEYEYISPDGNVTTYIWDGQAWNAESDFITGPKGEKGAKGEEGIQGEPFVWDDFTDEQLDYIKGEKGEVGLQGDAFVWDDFTQGQLDSIKGEKGQKGEYKGEKGERGARGSDGSNGSNGSNGTNSPESTSSTPNTLSKRDGSGNIRGNVITADSNLSSNGGCVLSGDLRCSSIDASNLVKCDRTEVAAVKFKNTGGGELRWIPEKSGDKLNLRTNTAGTIYYYQTSNIGWTALQSQSDPKLKKIKDKGTYAAPFEIDDIEIIDYEWDEDALAYAGLSNRHISGTVHTGFNAKNLEDLMPGSTIETDNLPQEDGTINPGTHLTIPFHTENELLAICVREIQMLRERLSKLEGGGG